MSLLIKIPFLFILGFASLYPLCVWIDYKIILNQSFYRFHTIFPAVLLFIACIISKLYHIGSSVFLFLWFYQMIIVAVLSWRKERVNPWIVSLPSLWGLYVVFVTQQQLFAVTFFQHCLIFLSHSVFISLNYTAVLGHWYLNMKGLPLLFLKRAVKVYITLMIFRIFLSGIMCLNQKVFYQGEQQSLFTFVQTIEGGLLLLAIFFSHIIAPLLAYMIFRVLSYKNTQATTGLLYVNVALLIMSEFFFKYYAFRYNLIV